MKQLILAITVIALISFISACSKSSSKSVSEKLVGNWTVTKTATDSNGNGQADANEWQPLQYNIGGFPVSISMTVNIKKGGTGMVNISIPAVFSDSSAFTWTTTNNDQYIALVADTSSTSGSLVNGVAHIDNLEDHLLVLKDTTGGNTWIYMTK